MTRDQVRLIRDSFETVREMPDEIALLFYGRLFNLDPSLRLLFKTGMREQSRKLMDMLTVVVDSVDRFDQLRPVLRELGQRHVGYGVRPEHYDTVAGALLWAFGRALDREFYAETRSAWAAVLADISREMQSGTGS